MLCVCTYMCVWLHIHHLVYLYMYPFATLFRRVGSDQPLSHAQSSRAHSQGWKETAHPVGAGVVHVTSTNMLLTGTQQESKGILEQKNIGGHPDPQDTPSHEPGLWAPTLHSLKHDMTFPLQLFFFNFFN